MSGELKFYYDHGNWIRRDIAVDVIVNTPSKEQKMSKWELITRNVKYSHQIPQYDEFVANTYWCTNCHNRIASREDEADLPKTCPWCGEQMSGVRK